MSRLKHEKYVFAWSRIRSGSVKALGCLGNLKQFHHKRRNVASPGAGKAPCLAPAAQANNWLLSWWSTRNLPYWFKQKEKKGLCFFFVVVLIHFKEQCFWDSALRKLEEWTWLVKYQKMPQRRAPNPLQKSCQDSSESQATLPRY